MPKQKTELPMSMWKGVNDTKVDAEAGTILQVCAQQSKPHRI